MAGEFGNFSSLNKKTVTFDALTKLAEKASKACETFNEKTKGSSNGKSANFGKAEADRNKTLQPFCNDLKTYKDETQKRLDLVDQALQKLESKAGIN